MLEKEFKVETYKVKAMCECGGEFKSSGMGFSNSAGSTWDHSCNKCRKTAGFERTYPALRYKEIDLTAAVMD